MKKKINYITLIIVFIRLIFIPAVAETFTPIPEDTLIDLLCYLARDVQSVYDSARGYPYNVMYWDGEKWHTDCNDLYKVVFSGWNKTLDGWNIKNPTRVGAYYSGSFVTGDLAPRGLIDACENQTRNYDFTTLGSRFECLFMPGTYDHFGGYLGKEVQYNGNIYNVVECTIAWEQGILFSYVDSDGTRRKYKGGPTNGRWERHAYAPSNWVNYTNGGDTPSHDDITTLSYENTTYTVTNDFNLKRQPYNDSDVMGTYGVGDTVSVKKVVLNKYNNVWLQVETGGYVFGGYKYENGMFTQDGTQYLSLKANNPIISVSGPNIPSGTLALGAGFEINGTINSSNSIKSVNAEIYSNGTLYASSDTWNSGNMTTQSLYLNNSVVNTTLKFGTLPAGNYTFKLNVTYYYDRGTKTATKTVYSTSFVIANSGTTPTTAYLDVNGRLDGSFCGDLGDCGTFDVYINGGLAADDVNDYYAAWPIGTSYEIRDIRTNKGYIYYGSGIYSLSGTIDNSGTDVELSFSRDGVLPTITNVKVSNITSSGYTVTCTVTDNVGVSKVQFPTWYAGQQGEDAIWHDGTLSGNTATCYIKVSDHDGKTGLYYHTDVYAWDTAGNMSLTAEARYNFVPNPGSESEFKLPKGLKEIGEEAFAGIDVSRVRVPDGVKTIGKRAFANCTKLEQIYIPEATTYIASDAFVNVPSSFVIRGKSNSYAQTYATNNGYRFVADTGNEWSDWVTEDQLPSGTIEKESKQQYRYQDKVYSDWSDWGSRTETRESTGELKKERQLTEHYWYYDLCQSCGRHSPYTTCWDCGHSIGQNWRVTWLDTSKNEGGQFGNSDKIFTMTDEGRWFYWTDDNGNGDSRTVYQYATRTFTWGNWSEWSDTLATASATRNVDERYVYRYKLP